MLTLKFKNTCTTQVNFEVPDNNSDYINCPVSGINNTDGI